MPGIDSFDYAIIKLVPWVERGESLNVGIILFCRRKRFLDCRIGLNPVRVLAFAPGFPLTQTEMQLALIPQICAGGPDSGPIGQLSQAERFHWLVAPRSTVIQTSEVHCGLCDDAQTALDHLFERFVAPISPN